MSEAALITLLQSISVVGSVLTAIKLFRTGLYLRYRWFFWYFLFRIPNMAWPPFFNVADRSYYYVWIATEPITWIFHIGVVLELYRLVLEKHKGLYTLGRWAMFAGLTISSAISLISLIPRMTLALTQQSKTMFWYLAMERGFMLGLAIFLLFIMGFLVLYTVPISRNLKIHARIYSIFFVSSYLAFLLRSYFGLKRGPVTDVAAEIVSVACVFAWLFLLSPTGELVRSTAPVIGPEQERRVLQQLDAFNETLLKVSKK